MLQVLGSTVATEPGPAANEPSHSPEALDSRPQPPSTPSFRSKEAVQPLKFKQNAIDLTFSSDDDIQYISERAVEYRRGGRTFRSRIREGFGMRSVPENPFNEDQSSTPEQYRPRATDINSSPIKGPGSTKHFHSTNASPVTPRNRKKSVAFSEFLVSDVPSSPLPGTTPRKSILKGMQGPEDMSPTDPNNTALWTKSGPEDHSPGNPKFWKAGTIIQLSPSSSNLPQLVEGCVSVLQNADFGKKFEVYATLNQICKNNSTVILLKVLGPKNTLTSASSPRPRSPGLPESYISELSKLVRRDVTSIEGALFGTEFAREPTPTPGKPDPFSTRIISQALKFIYTILSDPGLNTHLSISDIKWYYTHSCSMVLRQSISKTLLLPYLTLIKDCRFGSKRKRLIFDQQGSMCLLEQILFSLLNMKSFVSSSLVVEKLIALKNLVANFPGMMADNFDHWFGVLVINLCDLASPLYSKVITMGTSALLEVAKNFMDNKTIHMSVRKFLESPVPLEVKSFTSDSQISTNSSSDIKSSESTAIDYVIASLQLLVGSGQFKPAMDIWVGLTLLCGNCDFNFENWGHLSSWIQVHTLCFNNSDPVARIIAVSSWKAVIYNVCSGDLIELRKATKPMANSTLANVSLPVSNSKDGSSKNSALTNALSVLKPRMRLLIHVFVNVSSLGNQHEVIDALHSCFLSILYMLFSPMTVRNSWKYAHIYWEKIVHPVLTQFYFKKDESSAYMNQLGFQVLSRLVKGASPINDRNYNTVRCLSNELISINEINSLSPKWVYSRFDKVLQSLVLVFRLNSIDLDSKTSLLLQFLQTLKLITKREVKLSDTTYDIIENMPSILEVLLKYNKPSFDVVYRVLMSLNDTFGASALAGREGPSKNIYLFVLERVLQDFDEMQTREMLTVLSNTLTDAKNLPFIVDIVKLNQNFKLKGIEMFLKECLIRKRILKSSETDLAATGALFQILEKDYTIVAKRLIQDIVLTKKEEFERIVGVLEVQSWTMPIFKFFITLIRDAPYAHLKQMAMNLIVLKWETSDCFLELVTFLTDNKYDLEVYNLRKNILRKFKTLQGFPEFEFRQIWSRYLNSVISNANYLLLDDLLLCSYESEFGVKKFIRNKWSRLPRLSKAWLEKNASLEIDPDYPIEAPVQDEAEPQTTLNENSLSSYNQREGLPIQPNSNDGTILNRNTTEMTALNESIANDGRLIPDLPASLEDTVSNIGPESARPLKKRSKPKSRSTTPEAHDKPRKRLRRAKERAIAQSQGPESNKTNNGPFDIHSFTAMLTSKLSPNQEPPKKRRYVRHKKRTEAKPSPYSEGSSADISANLDDHDSSRGDEAHLGLYLEEEPVEGSSSTEQSETSAHPKRKASLSESSPLPNKKVVLVNAGSAQEPSTEDTHVETKTGGIDSVGSSAEVDIADANVKGVSESASASDDSIHSPAFGESVAQSISDNVPATPSKPQASEPDYIPAPTLGEPRKEALQKQVSNSHDSDGSGLKDATGASFNASSIQAHSTTASLHARAVATQTPKDTVNSTAVLVSVTTSTRTVAGAVLPVQSLSWYLNSVSDHDLSLMPAQDKHKLETELMKFMLRMRAALETSPASLSHN